MIGEYVIKSKDFTIKYDRVNEFVMDIFRNPMWNVFENSDELKILVRTTAYVSYDEYMKSGNTSVDYYRYLKDSVFNLLKYLIITKKISKDNIKDEFYAKFYKDFSDSEMICVLVDYALGMTGNFVNSENFIEYNKKLDASIIECGVSKEELYKSKSMARYKTYEGIKRLRRENGMKLTLD